MKDLMLVAFIAAPGVLALVVVGGTHWAAIPEPPASPCIERLASAAGGCDHPDHRLSVAHGPAVCRCDCYPAVRCL